MFLRGFLSKDLYNNWMVRTDRPRAILISYNKEDTLMPESEESIREMPLVIIESPFAGDVDTKK